MQDKATTVLACLEQYLSLPVGGIPLSKCKVLRPYLLERQGLPTQGTALLFAVPYVLCEDAVDPLRNLSLYAVPRDYHRYFEQLGRELLPWLKRRFPAFSFALFADHSPIDEVHAAALCGLGVIGLNGLLLHKTYGSFVFLAEIITDAPWEVATGLGTDDIPQGDPHSCRKCGACVRACPAKCLPDSRNGCLSALTQKKGDLSLPESDTLSSHPLVWGCDACQLACPYNQLVLKKSIDTPIPYFREQRCARITAELISAMPDESFSERAYAWRGKNVIMRNLDIKKP